MSNIPVKLGPRTYDILISGGLLAEAGRLVRPLAGDGRAVVITSRTISGLYRRTLDEALARADIRAEWIEIADGERSKSLGVTARVYDRLTELKVARDTPLVALGGGVVGDLTGFVAATYLRGLPYVQIPTTVVAQVDSAIGGKTAVNHRAAKNIIGAFHQPSLVIVDPRVLGTLPARQVRAGLGEIVKYAFLSGGELLGMLAARLPGWRRGDLAGIEPIIERCCAFKAAVVAEDERDIGRRAILNYGHTIGHAIETVSGYRGYLHGEAVAIGMHGAALLGVGLGLLDRKDLDLHLELLRGAGLPVTLGKLDTKALVAALGLDKKRQAGKLRFVLLDGIGRPIVREVPLAAADKVIRQLV